MLVAEASVAWKVRDENSTATISAAAPCASSAGAFELWRRGCVANDVFAASQ